MKHRFAVLFAVLMGACPPANCADPEAEESHGIELTLGVR